MAFFNWATCEIVMTNAAGAYHGTKADLANIPHDPSATMSFAHEYVHFLQLIGSLSGFHLLGELVDLAIKGVLLLSGHTEGETLTTCYPILPLLRAQPTGAGKGSVVGPRVQYLRDQAEVLFGAGDYAYTGASAPWQLVQQVVTVRSYTDRFVGIVTPRHTFRPITPGMLAEGMARRIDQWLKSNMGFAGHDWGHSNTEDEYYNGIRSIVAQAQYEHNVAPQIVDRLTVVICRLALASDRPDFATAVMLGRLMENVAAGGLVKTIAIILQELLRRDDVRLLRTKSFNDVMEDLQHGTARVMDREEFHAIYEQLKKIHRAGNLVFAHPEYFADEQIDWGQIRDWMMQFTVPAVIAADGEVPAIDGIPCSSAVTELLREIARVFL